MKLPISIIFLVAASAGAGCNRDSRVDSDKINRPESVKDARVNDIGLVLGNQRTLSYIYKLENGSDRTLRLTGAQAMTPCCSSIGPLPRSPILPGQVALVPVSFKTGGEPGNRRLEFLVRTDSPTTPTLPLVLTATCYDDWEMIPSDGVSRFTLKPGHAGKRSYRIVSRRLEVKGPPPRVVGSDPSITPLFEPGEVETISPEGFVEMARRLVVDIPATAEPGLKRAQVVLGVDDARTRSFDVEWFVAPCLTVSPSGLVIEREDGLTSRTIVLLSDERPFRVVGLSGPHLVGQFAPPAEARTKHRIELQFDTSGTGEREAFDICIKTDHPDQTVVNLGVLVLKKL